MTPNMYYIVFALYILMQYILYSIECPFWNIYCLKIGWHSTMKIFSYTCIFLMPSNGISEWVRLH